MPEGNTAPTGLRPRRPITTGITLTIALILVTIAFHKNAWVTDDAYITFRSIEQLHAGNGPRWNPHERVQAFTHPLWFGLLAVTRFASDHLFRNALLLSLALSLGTILLFPRILGAGRLRWILATGLLLSSRAWADYSWSGLENPLTFLLLLLFAERFYRAMASPASSGSIDRHFAWCACWTGLLILCRPDNAVFCLPAMAALLWRRTLTSTTPESLLLRCRNALLSLAIGFTPLIAWELFSLVYYGFLIPNTAYAKLNTGFSSQELWVQGLHFLANSLRWDTVTPVVLVGGAIFSLFRRPDRWLGLGVLLHLLYVVRVGGDFMAGRFLTGGFVLGVVLVTRVEWPRRWLVACLALVVAMQIALPSMPLFTPPDYQARWSFRAPEAHGIADEKGHYYGHNSWRLRWREPLDPYKPRYGVVVWDTIGFFGYGMPADTIVVDRFALTDPLLARLPAKPGSRIGHFERELPIGYLDSLRNGQNELQNPLLYDLYERLHTVTSQPLFTRRRARAIRDLHFATRRPTCAEPPCGKLTVVAGTPRPASLRRDASPVGAWPVGGGEILFVEGRHRRLRIAGRLDQPIGSTGQHYQVLTEVIPHTATLRYVRDFVGEVADSETSGGSTTLAGPGFEIVLSFDGREQRRQAAASLCLLFDSGAERMLLRAERPGCSLEIGARRADD